MCKRDTADPLARLFLDRYHLHLLRPPREDVDVGHVYPRENGTVSAPGHFRHLLDPAPDLPPINRGEAMADVKGTTSNEISAGVGLSLLDGFFSALKLAGIAGKIRAGVEGGKAVNLRFSFRDSARDSLDPFALEVALRRHPFDRTTSLLHENRRYYFVTAVVRSSSISFIALDANSRAVDIGAGIDQLADLDANVSVERSGGEEITVRGPKQLAFGVELQELLYDGDRKILRLRNAKDVIKVRRAEDGNAVTAMAPEFIGGMEGDIFLSEG